VIGWTCRWLRSSAVSLCSAAVLLCGAAAAEAQNRRPAPQSAAADSADPARRQSRHSVLALPVLMYSPETRIGVGAGGLYTRRPSPFQRPTTVNGLVLFTQERQLVLELGAERYTWFDRYRFGGRLAYRRFPGEFYGIGNNTREDDREEYTPRTVALGLVVERRVRGPLRVAASYELVDTRLAEVEEGGMLDRRTVRGAEGGLASGVEARISWDSRDNIFNPTSGSFHSLGVAGFGGVAGGDYSFARVGIDLRRYAPTWNGQVLAVQAIAVSTGNDAPFPMMPQLGGERLLRGYYAGRYIDRRLVALQAEYRVPVWRRIGVVGFGGAGAVAPEFSQLRIADLHFSGGGGVRFSLAPRDRLNVRLDFGYGGGGASGMYIGVTEAF
jgi:hypothetical protein